MRQLHIYNWEKHPFVAGGMACDFKASGFNFWASYIPCAAAIDLARGYLYEIVIFDSEGLIMHTQMFTAPQTKEQLSEVIHRFSVSVLKATDGYKRVRAELARIAAV